MVVEVVKVIQCSGEEGTNCVQLHQRQLIELWGGGGGGCVRWWWVCEVVMGVT